MHAGKPKRRQVIPTNSCRTAARKSTCGFGAVFEIECEFHYKEPQTDFGRGGEMITGRNAVMDMITAILCSPLR